MKKLIALALALILALSAASSALALTFKGEIGNDSTFETLEEAHANAPTFAAEIPANTATFVRHPALDDFPADTAWVYRSANMYGGQAAARLNTNIFVYTDEEFEDKAAAKAYLESLGLIDIIEEAVGSIVLVRPSVPVTTDSSGNVSGGSFELADAKVY